MLNLLKLQVHNILDRRDGGKVNMESKGERPNPWQAFLCGITCHAQIENADVGHIMSAFE